MRIKRVLTMMAATAVTIAAVAVAPSGTAYADTGNVTTPSDVVTTIDKVDARDGNLVKDAVPTAADTNSAAQTAAIDVPVDPSKGVVLTSPEGQTLTVGLPNAGTSDRGARTSKGSVAYGGRNGSASAVVPTKDGAQFLITIKNREAPTSYAYPVTLPKGGRVVVAPQGAGAAILDKNGHVMAGVEAPWAKDANGKSVRTYFTTNGKTLTQHVAHRASGVAYPVVSDPIVVWLMGVTLYCLIKGSYEARNLRGQPWYVWVWGLTLACLPF